MDWKALLADIRARGVTLDAIAQECKLSSKGHAHDIATGRQERVLWDAGQAILKMHKRVMRRKP
jgi:hypothetical protein